MNNSDKTEQKKKTMSILIGIIVLLLALFSSGVAYAYFTAVVSVRTDDNSLNINTGTLGLKYLDIPITCANGLFPGMSCTHNFYVENVGNTKVDYYVYLTDVINTFLTKEDLVFELSCQSVNTSTGTITGTCNSKNEKVVPNNESFILQQIIEKDITHNYTMKITFKETGLNQNDNQGKNFSGKILIVKEKREVLSKINVNIEKGMIPITYDGAKTVIADNENENESWYNYENQKWANMVLVTAETRSEYEKAKIGTEVKKEDILAYFVYIPRYKYKLWNTENVSIEEQEILIEFENRLAPKSAGKANGEWLTHPAFTFGTTELNGIWVGKFETSADKETSCYTSPSQANCNVKSGVTPRIVENADAWRYVNVSTFFEISKTMKSNGLYGISNTSADSHMIKNSEWGAVAYLSHSKYGKYGNENYIGVNKQIYINNYRNETNATLTGCSAGIPNKSSASSCTYAFPNMELSATGASTTGNLYGIYDMSGGADEYTMGNMSNETGAFYVSSAGVFTGGTPDSKYYDSYQFGTSHTDHSRGKLGDATKETLKNFGSETGGWYSDYAHMTFSASSWFTRGGTSNTSSSAGIFRFRSVSGSAMDSNSSRIVLAT